MTPANTVDLSVILPAYNESENLRELLPELYSILNQSGLSFEVIVVDAVVAIDDTESLCRFTGSKHIRRGGDGSYGDAVRSGIQVARGEHCIFMDADGSHTPELIPYLLKERSTSDVVIASRYVVGGGTKNGWFSRLLSRTLNFIYSRMLRVPCRDISNSYRLYKTEMLKQLELQARDFDIIEEIIFGLLQEFRHLRIVEVPFIFRRRFHGHSKRHPRFMLSFLTTLVRLRFCAWRS